jgi:hypothetical protein
MNDLKFKIAALNVVLNRFTGKGIFLPIKPVKICSCEEKKKGLSIADINFFVQALAN